MHIIFRLLIIVALVLAFVHGQGARGGGGGGGGIRSGIRSSGSRTSGGSTCRGDHCDRSGAIAGGVVGGLFGGLSILFTSVYCYRRWQGRPYRSNAAFVLNEDSEKKDVYDNEDLFQTGVWSSRYYQHSRWHTSVQFPLSFDRMLSLVNGQGMDEIGAFTIDGVYSSKTNRIALTKVYKVGTGNPSENFGHKVIIQLTWNPQMKQFEGKWFIRTDKYRGEEKFELKFVEAAKF